MQHPAKYFHGKPMHWLLMLALAFSPLQGAMAALSSGCDNAANVTIDINTRVNNGNAQMDPGMQHTCCDQDCCEDSSAVCSHGCNLLHAWSVLPAASIYLNADLVKTLHAQSIISYIGQTPPTLFRPPRSSV